jgi:hypothetical protein
MKVLTAADRIAAAFPEVLRRLLTRVRRRREEQRIAMLVEALGHPGLIADFPEGIPWLTNKEDSCDTLLRPTCPVHWPPHTKCDRSRSDDRPSRAVHRQRFGFAGC